MFCLFVKLINVVVGPVLGPTNKKAFCFSSVLWARRWTVTPAVHRGHRHRVDGRVDSARFEDSASQLRRTGKTVREQWVGAEGHTQTHQDHGWTLQKRCLASNSRALRGESRCPKNHQILEGPCMTHISEKKEQWLISGVNARTFQDSVVWDTPNHL